MKYIRFGEIPPDERSIIGNGCVGDGYLPIGKEKGVSVWNCVVIDGEYHLAAPLHYNRNTYGDFTHWAFPSQCCGCREYEKIYVVTGDEVGKGADNEPLLRNVQIVEELPYDYFKGVEATIKCCETCGHYKNNVCERTKTHPNKPKEWTCLDWKEEA